MSLIILNRMKNSQAFDVKWLGEGQDKLFLITTASAVVDEARFEKVIRVADYESSGRVEIECAKIIRAEVERGNFVRIVSTSESDVLRSSELREYFSLEGQSVETSRAFRDKIEMKKFIASAGLRVPAHARINSPIDLISFTDRNGFPIVVKPFDGASSVDTEVIADEKQLDGFLDRPWRRDLEAEVFAHGDLYHVDGFVFQNEMIFVWPSKYRTHCLSFKDGGYSGSFMLEPQHPLRERLQAFAADVIHSLPGTKTLSFHLEVFVDEEGEFTFLEIAARTGGGRINSILHQCFDINLNEIFVRSQAALPLSLESFHDLGLHPKKLMGWALIPPDTKFKSENIACLPREAAIRHCRIPAPHAISRAPEHSTDCAVEIEIVARDLESGLLELDRVVEGVRSNLSK